MRFKDICNEATLIDLYQSTVEAFPNTTKRQYATDPIKIVKLEWTPFLGVKTLFIKGHATNEGSFYMPMVLFKAVNYKEKIGKDVVELHTHKGEQVFLEKLNFFDNDVLLRCNCADFNWRFTHWNSVNKSLYGRDRKKYEAKHFPGSANPKELPGMCKHLIKTIKVLRESGIFN